MCHLWKKLKSCLLKMTIKCQCTFDLASPHDDKRDAAGQGISLVRPLLEQKPPCIKKLSRDVYDLYCIARLQTLPDLNSFRVTVTTVEEGDYLIEDIRRGNDQRG